MKERLPTFTAPLESVEQHSGTRIGRAIGDLSATQVACATDPADRPRLASRLLWNFCNGKTSTCKMSGSVKLVDVLTKVQSAQVSA